LPQLVKGGKYVYGWSTVSECGVVVIPGETVREYGISPDVPLMLIKGSRTSGGFGLTSSRLLEGTPLAGVECVSIGPPVCDTGNVTEVQPGLSGNPEGPDSGALSFRLTPEAMERFDVRAGARLLLVRGSGRALGFLARGPIYEEALRHAELREFNRTLHALDP